MLWRIRSFMWPKKHWILWLLSYWQSSISAHITPYQTKNPKCYSPVSCCQISLLVQSCHLSFSKQVLSWTWESCCRKGITILAPQTAVADGLVDDRREMIQGEASKLKETEEKYWYNTLVSVADRQRWPWHNLLWIQHLQDYLLQNCSFGQLIQEMH